MFNDDCYSRDRTPEVNPPSVQSHEANSWPTDDLSFAHRLKLAACAQQIVICTSPIAQDDPLVDIAAQEGVGCYRGHPDDVLLKIDRSSRGAQRRDNHQLYGR